MQKQKIEKTTIVMNVQRIAFLFVQFYNRADDKVSVESDQQILFLLLASFSSDRKKDRWS
jgi:hypothetical protein